MALMPLISSALPLSGLGKLATVFGSTAKMPVLFLGHGSPMNAIEENEFVLGFRNLAKELVTPQAILCISAHWETNGTFVTAMPRPRTIHDFGGFPQELFEVQYPAPGSPELAMEIKEIITKADVKADEKWGLDHGTWSVVKHLYPNADVPVIQMSIDYSRPPQFHYELARELAQLRTRGFLIIGSGNMVHNLRLVAWNKLNEPFAYDWAMEANEKMKALILSHHHERLVDYKSLGKAFELAIPTAEHFIPLLYILALQEKHESVTFFNDKPMAGSLTMTSLKIE